MNVNNVEENPDARPGVYDAKRRRIVEQLSDRELLEEAVTGLRAVQDLAKSFVESIETNPMLSKMGSMFGMGKR